MRIALDGIPLSEPRTGVGHYTFELAKALARSSPADQFELVSPRLFTSDFDTNALEQSILNLRFNSVRANIFDRRWFVHGASSYIKRKGIDLFHGANFEVPLRRVCPSVLTVHDLSLLNWSHTHLVSRVRRAKLRLPLMVRAATMLITPTEVIRREVCDQLNVEPDRVVSIPEAPREVFRIANPRETSEVLDRLGVKHPFFLAVGTIEPRKNLIGLLRAYRELIKSSDSRPGLVIAGKNGWMLDDIRDEIRDAGPNEQINVTGYVTDTDLQCLYSSCVGMVFPSLYEGFGLPPLEAMACGAPVISNDIPVLREVLGDAACFVNAESIPDLKAGMLALIENPELRLSLSKKSLIRSSEFSWERAAMLTLKVYSTAFKRFQRSG